MPENISPTNKIILGASGVFAVVGIAAMVYTAAATKLGVNEDALKAAMKAEEGKRPNMQEAATTLGVSVDELRAALGFGEGFGGRGSMINSQPTQKTLQESVKVEQ